LDDGIAGWIVLGDRWPRDGDGGERDKSSDEGVCAHSPRIVRPWRTTPVLEDRAERHRRHRFSYYKTS
jgi:hypothetical protein